ncbi:Glutathione S-transferase kappa 1 [Balamuthia mandrillaris]
MAQPGTKHVVEIFFDLVSPYSYLAFEVLHRYKEAWNLHIVYRPFFLGGVMASTGNSPPAYLPARARFMNRDITRNAQYFGVALRQPSYFPANTLLAQRLLTALLLRGKREDEDLVRRLSLTLWRYYWAEDKNIEQKEVIVEALRECGVSWEEVEQLLSTEVQREEVKQKLKQTTAEAVERGSFGAPTMFVFKDVPVEQLQGGWTAEGTRDKGEMFFGSDRFHHIAQLLGKQFDGPSPREASHKL